jgi:hypothetical protein
LRVSVFATKFRLFKARRTQSAKDISVDVEKATDQEAVEETLPIRQGHPVSAVVPKDILERRGEVTEPPIPLVGLGLSGFELYDEQGLFSKQELASVSMGREGSSSSSSSSGTGSPITPNMNVSYRYPEQKLPKLSVTEPRKSSEMNEEDLGDATSILSVLFGGVENADFRPWYVCYSP